MKDGWEAGIDFTARVRPEKNEERRKQLERFLHPRAGGTLQGVRRSPRLASRPGLRDGLRPFLPPGSNPLPTPDGRECKLPRSI